MSVVMDPLLATTPFCLTFFLPNNGEDIFVYSPGALFDAIYRPVLESYEIAIIEGRLMI